jgi:hypothetical protein
MIAALVGGYWLALRRANIPSPTRQINWAIVSALLIGWYAIVWWLGARGALTARPGHPPPLPLGLVIPIGIGLVILPRFKSFATAVKLASAWFLIGVQVYRVLGGNFIALWALGAPVPAIFALPAGLGDVLTGVLAIPAAIYVARQGRYWRGVGAAWNVLGIADLINALALGFMTGPGPLQVLALDHPNLVATTYPTVLTPFFVVPLSIVLHGLSLWQLRKHGQAQDSPEAGMSWQAAQSR